MYGPVFRCCFTFVVLSAVNAHSSETAKGWNNNPSNRGDWSQRLSAHDRWNQRWGGETPHSRRGGNGRGQQRSAHDRESSPQGRFSQRPHADRTGTGFVRWTQQPVSTGYVFIDGKYLPPPYTVRIDDRKLLVNDHQVTLPPSGESDEEQQSANPAMPWSHRLAKELRMGAVVVASSNSEGEPAITFLPRFDEGYEILKHISDATTYESASTDVPACWAQFAGYEPSPELRSRLELDLANLESAGVLRTPSVVTDESLGSWAYPLTAVAMFLVAVASGQLFVSRSLLINDGNRDASEFSKATQRCLLFVVGLSVLDLACTLSALQAGVMHELNPLAGQFLGSPWALTAFKIGVTLGGAALLYALRSHFPARRAAWWLCLVCVLVAARWVAFNSLFIA